MSTNLNPNPLASAGRAGRRNPFAVAARLRHAGAHRRGTSGLRQRDQRALQRELRDLHEQAPPR